MPELIVALGILSITVIPLSYSFWREDNLCRAYYYRAIAMEIVDGEMEGLAAGRWRAYSPGTHPYAVRANSAKNLPDGRFVLTLAPGQLQLEWLPADKGRGGRVVRRVELPTVAAP